jgi:hypothetical protein
LTLFFFYLVAGQVYLKRKVLAEMVLKDLEETVRTSTLIRQMLTVVINIMQEHVRREYYSFIGWGGGEGCSQLKGTVQRKLTGVASYINQEVFHSH